jgi:extracellular elastinolytic metalloproteinase
MRYQLLWFNLILFCFTVSSKIHAQATNALEIAQQYVQEQRGEWKASANDLRDLVVSDNYVSSHNKVTHIYFIQRYQGIEILNGVINVNITKEGKVLFAGFNGVTNVESKVNAITATLTPQEALDAAVEYLKLEKPARWQALASAKHNTYLFDKNEVAYENIKVKLQFVPINTKALRLAWLVEIEPKKGQDLWNIAVDAVTGTVIQKFSLTAHCSFHNHNAARGYEFYHNCIDQQAQKEAKNTPSYSPNFIVANPVATYNVFKLPVESPVHGSRAMAYDTLYTPASPYGWHDVNGVAGAEFTITRGNNVHAYEDTKSQNQSQGNEPNGGANLVFDYPFDITAEPLANQNAATVNLFYANNFMHDITFKYGFDEAAGNFQQRNYTNKGVGNDAVQAEARDGSGTNNANFATPSDGGRPRMQMYEWEPGGRVLKVTSPSSIANDYEAGLADFGAKLTATPITGTLVIAKDLSSNPTFACNKVQNASEVQGKIAIVDRGGCFFNNKVYNAQLAGAIAVIVVNFESGVNNMGVGDAAVAAKVTIPAVSVSKETGEILKNALKKGDVTVSLAIPPSLKPTRIDGDFDNGIIAHEYGHGISNRLTGGPQLSSCLNNGEQMGEGWSDFFSLIVQAKPGDNGAMARGIGNFANRGTPSDIGIRTYPYSTDMSINPDTYSQSTGAGVHRLGSVWAAMLWDLYWKMADLEGYDPDLINGKGGNNKAIQLVMDGMKLQRCEPGFVDGRNAILKADEVNYEGAYKCLIWEVFARRGLGFDADQGSSYNNGDTKEGFSTIPECLKTLKIEKKSSDLVSVNTEVVITLDVRNDMDKDATNTIVTDIIPQGLSYVDGSASDGGTFNNGVISFNLGSFAKGAKKTLTYKVKVGGSASKSIYFEGFNGPKTFTDDWETEQEIGTGAYFDVTQASAYEGTWALQAELNAAFESNSTANLGAGKGVLVTGSQPVLRFYQNYKIQHGVDGVVVYLSKDDGTTWIDAGKFMFQNGYNGPIAYSTYSIPNTRGFWGDSKGWVPTFIDLKDYIGEKVQFRFRMLGDGTASEDGFEQGISIDNIEIFDLVNYNTEACINADGNIKACKAMDFRGIKVETDRATDTKEVVEQIHAALFPNPTQDVLNINLKSDNNGNAAIEFINMNGQVVQKQQVWLDSEGQMFQFSLGNLPAGLYTVRVSQTNGSIIKRFAKL